MHILAAVRQLSEIVGLDVNVVTINIIIRKKLKFKKKARSGTYILCSSSDFEAEEFPLENHSKKAIGSRMVHQKICIFYPHRRNVCK